MGHPIRARSGKRLPGTPGRRSTGSCSNARASSRFHEACDAIGLAPGGLKTLLQLSPDQPVPMRDLAEYFRCDPSYVTSLVDGLESAGLAERRSHATDRRVKMVVLSHSGVEAQAQVRKILGQPPASFSALTTPELLRLRSLLAKLDPPERPPAD